jgi:hypothetical protein
VDQRTHPKDVYDGEEGKYNDFSRTLPPHLADLAAEAERRGERTVMLFEDWQTASAAIGAATLCRARGIHAPMFWNANNTYGFGRVDFPILRRVASITTISRYMRMELLKVDVEAAILPNGIADRWLKPLPPSDGSVLRKSFNERPTFVKVARFDRDKRWLWAIDAIAAMRDAGMRPRFIMRGSRSDYAETVGTRISRARPEHRTPRAAGTAIPRGTSHPRSRRRPRRSCSSTSSSTERTLRALYARADGVLANSEKEPFGLVGLEVMACGGIAYVGRTGEDYAVPFGNAVVMQSDDPRELLTSYRRFATAPSAAPSRRRSARPRSDSRGRASSRATSPCGRRVRANDLDPLEDLVAHRAPDRPRIFFPLPAFRCIRRPAHAVHETQVVIQVALQMTVGLRRARDARSDRRAASGTIRSRPLWRRSDRRCGRSAAPRVRSRSHRPDRYLPLATWCSAWAKTRGLRTRVDEDAARPQDPVGFLQGIDHALSWDASERPREDRHVEMPISEGQRLCDADLELHVRDIELACFHARESDRFGIRIDAYDLRRVRRAPERHAPVTAAMSITRLPRTRPTPPYSRSSCCGGGRSSDEIAGRSLPTPLVLAALELVAMTTATI